MLFKYISTQDCTSYDGCNKRVWFFVIGLVTACICVVLDQAVKHLLLFRFDILERGPFHITSFLDFCSVWNSGISYGWFSHFGVVGRYLISMLTLAAILVLSVCLWLISNITFSLAAGLIIGGSLGNLIDRITYGSVFDYIHFFLPNKSFSWYVFNLADLFICTGAGLMIIYTSRKRN